MCPPELRLPVDTCRSNSRQAKLALANSLSALHRSTSRAIPLRQQKVTFQASELECAAWMPLSDYVALPTHTPLNLQLMASCLAYLDGSYRGLWARKVQAGYKAQEDLLMFGEQSLDGGKDEDAWLGLVK